MKFIIADTETTGFKPEIDDVISFGAFSIETNERGLLDLNTIKGIHKFFYIDKEVPADASAVNHLTRKILGERSGFRYLEDCVDDISEFVYQPDAVLCGYNIKFDYSMLKYNFMRNGLKPPVYKSTFDVMNEQKILLRGNGYDKLRAIKLVQAVDVIFRQKKGVTKKQLEDSFNVCVKACGINNAYAEYHSALYDAFVTMMILREILLLKNK